MMPITKDLLDQLLNEYEKPEDLLGDQGILQQLTKALVERASEGELTHHLGYQKHDLTGNNSGNSRNGTSPKTIKSKRGQTEIEVPRDRNSTFEPQLIKKNQARFDGFDEKIISLYARRMTTREIQGHLQEIYGTEISPALVSAATEAVLAEVRAWQSRPLDSVYPILYPDALIVKVKENGRVINKAVYLVIGVNLQGLKEVLGIWIAENEGAKFRLSIVTELQTRGVEDVFIACVDGLKGFPEAIEAVYPKTQVQRVSGASAAAFFELCVLQRAQRSGCRSETDLYGGDPRRSRKPSFGICRKVGNALSGRGSARGSPIGRELSRCSLLRRKSGGRFTPRTRLNR